MRPQIKEARSQGHSDSEILDFISERDKKLTPKISEALESGHDPSDILNHLFPEPHRAKSIIAAPLKGVAKGIGALAEFAVPLAFEEEPLEERQKLMKGASEAREKFEKGALEEALPTQNKFLERGLERGGELFPSAAIGPGGLIQAGVRSFLGGLGSEAIKSAGGGPLAQAVTEIMAFGMPGFGKKVIPNKSQKSLVDFARKMGLTEEEFTPLIQGKGKIGFFGKLAKKGEKSEEALQKSLDARKRIYSQLENSPLAQKPIPQNVAVDFLNETSTLMKKLPANMRDKVLADYMDFIRTLQSGKGNAAELMNLWTDLNYEIGQGSKGLGILKEPIENVFKKSYPGFSQDFELTRELYKRFYPISKKLKPSVTENLIDAGELGALAHGILKGKMGLLTELLGIETARRLSREMLINPRMQNLHLQMLRAANDNKFSIVKSVADKMLELSNQESPKQKQESQ